MSRRGSRPPNTSLYVRNIPDHARPEDIRQAFSKYGPVSDVYIPLDHYTREPRGFCYVQHKSKDQVAWIHVVKSHDIRHVYASRYVYRGCGVVPWPAAMQQDINGMSSCRVAMERKQFALAFDYVRDAEEAMYKLDRTRLFGREMDIQFAEGERKTPSQMRGRDSYPRRRRRSYSRSPDYKRSRSRSRSRSPYWQNRRGRSRSRSRSRSPTPDRNERKRRRRKRSVSRSRSRSRSYTRSRTRSRSR